MSIFDFHVWGKNNTTPEDSSGDITQSDIMQSNTQDFASAASAAIDWNKAYMSQSQAQASGTNSLSGMSGVQGNAFNNGGILQANGVGIRTANIGAYNGHISQMFRYTPKVSEATVFTAVVGEVYAIETSPFAMYMATVEEMPHKLYEDALMLHAAKSDVVDEVVQIPRIGTVRCIRPGTWVYRIYD